ncbi:MAG TPA: GAF domain-containing protein [Archangium sp.]|uniref:GAF domain-containing sensor histidine kinase n=1 Tax=Archangium sp. TaxID=1872627 RepID=UPI002E349F30|nr:GAF domain-containing protein [Archangium sp.]HEX5748394.1 GAF domain-containing protein [Archangium sp.]
MAGSDTSTSPEAPLRLCDFIRRHRARVLESWAGQAGLLPGIQGLSRPQLLDHLPDLLDRIANVVETVHTGEHRTLEEFPEMHALERLDAGLDLEQVASEYALLRACILKLYSEHVGERNAGVVVREMLYFNQTCDTAVVTAVARYARARERTLVALDRLSEAALGTEDLDTFLPRLLRVILESTESVDALALLLRDGDTLRVGASVGLGEEESTGFSLKVGEGFAGTIAAERRPKELRSASTRGIQALYGVPLLDGERVIGVAHMGSRTTHEFSNEDKLLFRVMVGRAASLIVQAQLVAREREALARVRAQEERAVRLQAVTAALSQALTTTDVARVVVDKAVRALGAMGGSIGLLSEDGQWFEMLEAQGHRDEVVRDWTRFPADAPVMFRQVVSTRAPVLYETVEHFLADYPQWEVLAREEGHGAFATLPLLADGQVLGAMGLTFRERRTFSAEEVAFMRVLAGQCAQALERSRLYDAEQRARAEAHLHLTRLNLIMDTAPVGLAFLDTELRYVRINERLAEMNGRSVADHLGRTVREVLPGLASTLEALFHRVLETGQPVVDLEVTGETPAHPGVQRHWLVSYYRVQDVKGPPLGLGGVVVEITDRKRAEEELRRTAEFRELFLGIVSHDLRNPLNAIRLSASTLLHSEGVEKHQLKAVRRITTSAERMGRMISDLLDFTRGRLGGGIPIHPRPANLRHICQNVVEELEAGHPERKLKLTAVGRFQGAWDPDRLAQAFGNLGKNALEYSPEGSLVDFVLRDEGDTVRLEVHNEGPPIPVEGLSSVFEPFQRAVEHTGSSGLGLGLFIVQQIITAHGGTVEVRSTEAEGTTFTVRLPRHAVEKSQGTPAK